MQTFIVYTKTVKTPQGKVNQEISREEVSSDLSSLEGLRDFIVNKEGNLFKVVEKIADLRGEELRILVRDA